MGTAIVWEPTLLKILFFRLDVHFYIILYMCYEMPMQISSKRHHFWSGYVIPRLFFDQASTTSAEVSLTSVEHTKKTFDAFKCFAFVFPLYL